MIVAQSQDVESDLESPIDIFVASCFDFKWKLGPVQGAKSMMVPSEVAIFFNWSRKLKKGPGHYVE